MFSVCTLTALGLIGKPIRQTDAANIQTGGNISIGRRIGGSPQQWTGIIDDVSIYKAGLDMGAIQKLYLAGLETHKLNI